jgi:trans-aconitate 3-methyltransferase
MLRLFLFLFFIITNVLSLVMIDDIRGGDITIRLWKDLRENALKATPDAKVGLEDTVLLEWPVALILTRKV